MRDEKGGERETKQIGGAPQGENEKKEKKKAECGTKCVARKGNGKER